VKLSSKITRRELTVESEGVSLAGSLWLPSDRPAATILMHPGSGPSNRDNDVYFPPIREHLLASGFAVSSFDKRGVGGSTGRWQEAGIPEQAEDVRAAVDVLLADDDLDGSVGVFGHSQGGWVVVEAAGRGAPFAFVVSNSGPGVTPAEQERYATRTYLTRNGLTSAEIEKELEHFDLLADMMRAGASLKDIPGWTEGAGIPTGFLDVELPLFPDNVELWDFMAAILDYDPRPALERIDVPVLALFGGDDTIVPVDDSVAVYREAVRRELLTVVVFEGGNHRIQAGDPPALVGGYLETLSSFAAAAAV
jgi:uncharacterized protein